MQDKKNLLAIKCAILDMDLDKEVNKAHLANFRYGDETAKNAFIEQYGVEWYKIACNINKARDMRFKRVFDRIGSLLLDEKLQSYFLTLTFTNEMFASTAPATRRIYVARWLKKYQGIYLANLDFGEKKGREHYHALCFQRCSRESLKAWHKYGAIKVLKVHDAKGDKKAVTKYVLKLSRHFYKDSTLKAGYTPRIIFPRVNYKKFKFTEVF